MADPLSIASGVVALVTFALTSSATLYTTIRDFQSQDRKVRSLKNELGDLVSVLQALLDTIKNNPDLNFETLKAPIHRCGNACKEYGELISRFTQRSTASRSSVRDWITQKYLQGDVSDFKETLAAYKSTINIALANATIRVAAITPRVLEDYKDMISDTTQDLREHLQKLEEKIQHLSLDNAQDSNYDSIEWHAMMEEKKSTQQGLELCAQLSARIEQLDAIPDEHSQFAYRPSAHKFVKNGLNATKGSIHTTVTQLLSHEKDVDKQMQAMAATVPPSRNTAVELERLQETKDSIHQCIKVISEADDTAAIERHNVFEDITLADEAYNFAISTVGDLVIARRINLTGRSRNIGGQMSDESYQKTIDALLKQELQDVQQTTSDCDQTASALGSKGDHNQGSEFHNRHGRGLRLSK